MPREFQDRVAVITGAGSGIGRATAKLLSEGGARIVGVDRNEKRLQETLASLPATGVRHEMIVKDLRPAASGREVLSQVIERTGRVDILVNSAGVCHFNRIQEIDAAEWDEVMEIDVRALFYMSVAAAEAMNPDRGGRIVNLGSNAGRKGRALSAHYAAAKAAVANITESLALAYGKKNITVNTVSPGPAETPMWDDLFPELLKITGKSGRELSEGWAKQTPLGRLAKAEDVAHLISFLAGDKAAFITGQTINVCGGFMLTC